MIKKTLIIALVFLFFKPCLFSFSNYFKDNDALKVASYNTTEDATVYDSDKEEYFESGYLYKIDFQIGYFREGNNITIKISGENGDVVYSSEEYKNLIKIETVAYTLEGKKKNNKAEGSENANLLPLCKVGDTLQVDNNTELFIMQDETKMSYNASKIVVFVDKKKYAECNSDMLNGGNEYEGIDKTMGEYIYIDRLNKQFYYVGSESNGGIFRYDIKRNKIEEIVKGSSIMAPMRLPNTPYLVFGIWEWEDEYKREIQETYTSIYIKEILEWKAEIEKQEENKKLYPNAKKAFIDGPANIRDNPNGKNIAMLDDLMEVLILNQEGGWYEILYADVRGWTYKDNLRDIK